MVGMIDVGRKKIVDREAVAEGRIRLKPSTLSAIVRGEIKKGDVVTSSKLAGIQAAKATSQLLPLCHQIPLTSISVDITMQGRVLAARCTVSARYSTGVEMEALVGASAALLNVWDMVKYLEKDKRGQYPETSILDLRVLSKKKGGRRDGSR